jgi:UDP-N-acetylmuramoyl-L-alanyl-D-glutamate--2,6-diaminopimelate ligase
MRTQEVEAAVMEVSSHGLELGRVEGCAFQVAAFTNLTQDHLDFHGNMEAYRESKTQLFARYLKRGGTAVINLDDPSADAFVWASRRSEARILGVSRDAERGAEVFLESAEVSLDGTRARVHTPTGPIDVSLPLVGDFNVENMLVACGVGVAMAVDMDVLVRGIEACPQVPGRAERIGSDVPNAPTVVVDYAHTPDAVDKLLRTLRPLTSGRLIALFGCGGDRDRAKRPLMAEAVARWSDRIVATSDNPRSEDPLAILADVEAGLAVLQRVESSALDDATGAYALIPDRRDAIETAVSIGRPGDIVVIAGKGHEDYLIVGRERLPFSDSEEALRVLSTGRPQ